MKRVTSCWVSTMDQSFKQKRPLNIDKQNKNASHFYGAWHDDSYAMTFMTAKPMKALE